MSNPLPEKIEAEVTQLIDEGEQHLDEEEDEQALAKFQAAWDLIPEPRDEWELTMEVLCGIADCQFFLGDFEACCQGMQLALRYGAEPDNPYVCLRLGQCYLELGDEAQAGNWLTGVFMVEGVEIFEDEDPKYWAFLKPRLDPPPEGWPEGW